MLDTFFIAERLMYAFSLARDLVVQTGLGDLHRAASTFRGHA